MRGRTALIGALGGSRPALEPQMPMPKRPPRKPSDDTVPLPGPVVLDDSSLGRALQEIDSWPGTYRNQQSSAQEGPLSEAAMERAGDEAEAEAALMIRALGGRLLPLDFEGEPYGAAMLDLTKRT